MPLITCPDCGREVSDRAPTCPQCGAPIASPTVTQPDPAVVVQQPAEVQARSGVMDGVKLGCGMFIVLPLIILLIIWILMAIAGTAGR